MRFNSIVVFCLVLLLVGVVVSFLRQSQSDRETRRILHAIWVVANSIRNEEGQLAVEGGPVRVLGGEHSHCPECSAQFVWATTGAEKSNGRFVLPFGLRTPIVRCSTPHADGRVWVLFGNGDRAKVTWGQNR